MPIHVRCEQNVAPIVFLPGDPNRAKWIAENVFEGAICTTSYRQNVGLYGACRRCSGEHSDDGDGRPVGGDRL